MWTPRKVTVILVRKFRRRTWDEKVIIMVTLKGEESYCELRIHPAPPSPPIL